MRYYSSDDVKRLIERFRDNEEVARKFFEVEMGVLSTLNFHDFFDKLLSNIMEKFGVGFVWVTLIDRGKVVKLVNTYASPAIPPKNLRILERKKFFQALGGSGKAVLGNQGLERFSVLMPGGRERKFGSIAIVPISLDGETAGSINFADASPGRFSPEADTILLEQLGIVVSICLSNVAAHEELRSLAFKDPLTGLVNRRAMERALKREIGRSKRYGSPLSVAFIDLDDFKKINDSLGHDSGDELLVHVADALVRMTRQSDVVSRFAGDEFVVILPQTSAEEAASLMGRIGQHFLEHPLTLGETPVRVAFSCGIAGPDHETGEDPASLLKKADELLYGDKQARKAGR